uniref:CCN family member 5 n=1 Tax=Apteryx owenii TaxID=8824 RepID=A0A8B9P9R5_APTOW
MPAHGIFILHLPPPPVHSVCAQLCQRPCYCPWAPPRCPRGSPLVLDGCGCCKICARRLGEPCDFLAVCDQSQGLVCDYSAARAVEDDEESCEVNGRVYRDGEVFQPSCKLQCRCLDGGVTCVPLCQEDVRLPTPDCPHPRRVDVPGKCCQEWISSAGLWVRPLPPAPWLAPLALPYPCKEWSTEWSACSATCGMGFSTRVSNQNHYCRLETQRRLCVVRPCQALPGASPAVSEAFGDSDISGQWVGQREGNSSQHKSCGTPQAPVDTPSSFSPPQARTNHISGSEKPSPETALGKHTPAIDGRCRVEFWDLWMSGSKSTDGNHVALSPTGWLNMPL